MSQDEPLDCKGTVQSSSECLGGHINHPQTLPSMVDDRAAGRAAPNAFGPGHGRISLVGVASARGCDPPA
jgi:hypothetical protein